MRNKMKIGYSKDNESISLYIDREINHFSLASAPW